MGDVENETRRELEDRRAQEVAPGLAAVALRLAKQMDRVPLKNPTAAAVVARELRGALQELRRVAPVAQEGDAVDELTRRRGERRAAARAKQQSG